MVDSRSMVGDYFSHEADLEGSLDLPILGRLDWEPRFMQRHEDLQGFAPDPTHAERLARFVPLDPPGVWVLGLGGTGEEVPVAVGLAQQATGPDRGAVFLIGPEVERPSGVSTSGLRPVSPGAYGPLVDTIFPQGCGAQATGLQGVYRLWPEADPEAAPIEASGMILATHTAEEARRPEPEAVSGVVLVVPYRDLPAAVIAEQVTNLRAFDYPLLGMVTVSAPAGAPPSAGSAWSDPEETMADGQGGAMNETAHVERKPPEEEMEAAATEDLGPEEAPPEGEGPERVAVQDTWSDNFGPGARRQRSKGAALFGIPWWVLVVVMILVAIAGLIATRLIGVESVPESEAPPFVSTPPAESEEIQAEVPATPVEEAPPVVSDAPVRVSPPRPAMEEAAPVAPPMEGPRPVLTTSGPPYALLCGSFRKVELADREVSRLRSLELDARTAAVEIPEKGVWNRVVVGSWPALAEARQVAVRAVSEGWVKEAFVVSESGYGRLIHPPRQD